jgi:hypothetical protein
MVERSVATRSLTLIRELNIHLPSSALVGKNPTELFHSNSEAKRCAPHAQSISLGSSRLTNHFRLFPPQYGGAPSCCNHTPCRTSSNTNGITAWRKTIGGQTARVLVGEGPIGMYATYQLATLRWSRSHIHVHEWHEEHLVTENYFCGLRRLSHTARPLRWGKEYF